MKKIATLVLTFSVLFNLYAQNSFDTANVTKKLSALRSDSITEASKNEMVPVKQVISIMPAAGTQSIKVLYTSQISDNAAISIFNEDGKKLISQKASLSIGKNNIVINNFSSLTEGAYLVSLVSNGITYTSSFIVWK